MTQERAVLQAEVRETLGKGASRALRRARRVPAVIYGAGKDAVHVAIDEAAISRLALKLRFHSRLIQVEAGKQSFTVLPREVQYHPVTDRIEHVDFLDVNENSVVTVWVPVQFVNHEKSPGLKRGGTLNIVRREVELECKATNIPSELVADLTGLKIAESVHISHIHLPEGVKPVIDDRDFTVATIVGRRGDKGGDEEGAEA